MIVPFLKYDYCLLMWFCFFFKSLNSAKSEGSGVTFLLGTKDAEAAVAKAVDAGAVKVEVTEAEVELGFKGKVTDPFGVTWIFAEKKTVITDENKEV